VDFVEMASKWSIKEQISKMRAAQRQQAIKDKGRQMRATVVEQGANRVEQSGASAASEERIERFRAAFSPRRHGRTE